MKRISPLLMSICLLTCSTFIFAQNPCNIDFDPGTPGNTTAADAGLSIPDVDMSTNYFNVSPYTPPASTGGAASLTVNDGTEFCDENGNGMQTGSEEGPDLVIMIPVPPENQLSCSDGVLTICLRGDFNNACEVAFIADGSGAILSQSTTTGNPACAGPPTCLDIIIPACDLNADAVDGMILFEIRTNGEAVSTGATGDQVDDTCTNGADAVDLSGDGNPDGNCMTFDSFVWPTTVPEIICPADVTLECTDSTDPADTGEPTFTGECVDDASFTFEDVVVGTCPSVITRTWTATICNDPEIPFFELTCDQIITIEDTTPPVITCPEPADTPLLCGEVPTPGQATATDNCTTFDAPIDGVPDMMPEDIDPCTGGVITYLFTAIDDCGLEAMCMQTFTYEPDMEAPVLSEMPADVDLVCGDPIPEVPMITATDNCTDPVDVVFEETMMGTCPDPTVIMRTWTATDDCSNVTTHTQTINIPADDTPPVLSDMPADLNLVCTDAIPPADVVTATDDCIDPIDVVFEEVDDMGVCPDPRIITRTWTATDACMNEATYTQTITVAPDVTPPVLSDMPADLALTCADPIPPADPITATDDCTDPQDVVFEETDTGMCPENRVITRTWTATDDCGNETTYTQTITITPDTTPPVLSEEPADENLTCADAIPAAPAVTATDDCTDPIEVVFEETDDMGFCPDPRIITRTWTATDECMNETTYTQTITIAPDTELPVFDQPEPADIDLACGDPAPEVPTITATDNCTDPITVEFTEETVGTCPDATVTTRTWTATDDCGNSVTYDQVITLPADGTPPVLSDMPADLDLICTDAIPPADPITATDDCTDPIDVVFEETDDMGVCPDPRIITRTWTATDACMNETTYTQTITVAPDTTPPVLSEEPADENLTCADAIPPAANVTATDDCTDPQDVVFEETDTGMCPENRVITRTWTATDECGNETTYTQTITIAPDTTPPVLSEEPADENLTCADAIPAASAVTATDDCTDPIEVVFEETDDMGVCPDPRIITRTWTATDDCGNETTYTQTITIAPDDTPPVITCPPDDPTVYTLETDIPAAATDIAEFEGLGGTAMDDCGIMTLTSADEVTPCPGAANQGEVVRTYTITDECGNMSECTQTFVFSCCDAAAGALAPIDDICIGESISTTVDGTEAPAPDYGYDYVLTDVAGAIIAGPNTTGMFTPMAAGDYCVHGVSYQIATGAPDYSSGDINTITQPTDCIDTTSECFTVTDPPTVTIGECAAGPPPIQVYTGLDGTYPDGSVDVLPDVYVFCEPGCVEATGADGVAPYMYEWFELSDECTYDFAAPIANTPDASGLGTGTYSVVVTDANGCTNTGEVKVFIDDMATLTASADSTLCANETFDLEGTSLPGPGFCLEYCGGELPQCPIDANSIITVCMEFTHTYISDLSFELVAPDGTVIPLVMGQCCPNGSNDATMFCFTNDTSGGAVALDWNTTGAGGTDLLGTGAGISGNWLPEGGAAAFGGLAGVDANGGPWAMIVTDIIGGDSGQFESFDVTITSPAGDCNTVFESPVFGAPIPDNQESFTYETPVEECVEQPNCTASYQWTGSDGFDSGVQTIANQTDQLETFPPLPVTPPAGTTTYTLTVTDCFGCTFTEEVIITITDEIIAEAASAACGELDITSITGGTPDYTITIGLNPDASDALATATVTDASAMPEFMDLAAGDYFIAIEDANGCTALIGPVTVESCCDVAPGMLAPIEDICVGLSITTTVDGTQNTDPDYAYEYVLTDASGMIISGPQATGDFTPAPAGMYCVYGVNYNATDGMVDYSSGDMNTITHPTDCADATNTCFNVTDGPTVTIGECAAGPAPTNVYTGLEGTYPMDVVDILPDIYVFCEPGCVEATGADGTAPYMYEWFELSDECGYDFNAPIANTPDASGLGTGTYSVVVTDASGCTATGEVKVFVDEPPTLTASADTTLCAGETFDLEGTSLPGPGICLEYCEGELPVCLIDDNTIFTVCFDFQYSWISDLNLQLQAPNGTILTLVSSQAYPNNDMDGNMCFTNDANAGNGVLPGGALDALNWNNYPAGTADAAGLGIGISGNWFPEGGQGAFSVFNGVDANSGTWQVIILDDLPGLEGFFNSFTLDIVNPDCEYSVAVDINMPIIDFVPTTIMTEPIECEELANCTATYQWTGSDGFDSGVQTITPQTDILETFPLTNVTPPAGTTTYTLTVTDCFGCVSTEEVVITVADEIMAEAASPECGQLDITAITGGTPDYTVTIGLNPDASDALATATITDASAMPEFMDLTEGDYFIAIEDANGCTALIGPVTVESCEPECDLTVDVGECAAGPAPNIVYEDLEGTYPDGQLDTLPDVYVFCEPGCVEAFPTGGTAPLTYEWFELSMECAYDFNAPIASTADASGLGTGTYTVVVTDAEGCTASQEVKVFVDEDDILTVPADTTLCVAGPFDLEGSSLPSPGFCLEYCGGALPVCPIDADALITVCLEFTHTYISDLSFDLVAPDGTVIPLVTAQCCPNGANDGSQFCFTNDTAGGAVALDWNTTGAANTDLLGIGVGISGDWLPTGGAGVFNGLAGVDANGGPWAMIVTDIVGGDSGQFESFNVTIEGANCNTVFQSPVFGAPIPDNQESFTYETPVEECVEQPNCTASYQWTGDDGTDSGVLTIANQSDQLETFPPFTVNPPAGTTTYTLTVTDCFGCISTEEVVVTVGEITAMATSAACGELDITDITGGTPDYTVTIGMMPDASDAIATAALTDASAMPEFVDLTGGDYYISIVDADGCSVVIGPITVEDCNTGGCDDFMVDVAPCADLPPNEIYEDLIGLYPMDMTDTLPDVYVFCEPGCVSGVAMGGTAPLDYQWFELSDECGYDFNSPIATTQDASGLGSGVYTVVVTDAEGCTASQEVKVFVNTPPELTTSDDAIVCAGDAFDLEGTSLPTAGFCLEYCEGDLPMCIVDDNTIFTVCFDFQYSWISDLNLQLQAPDGTLLTLVSSEAYPNSDMDGNMCFTNDANAGNGVLPGGALDALDWNNYPSGTADAAGLGIGISGNWFPEGGQGAFSAFNGVDANSGVWQVIILDDLPGLEGFFNSFTLDIINPDCSYSVAVDINMPIIDFVPTTIVTEPIECEDLENCTASYQWTGSDGFDSGVIPIANQQNMLETLPPVTITGSGMDATYILTVTDCFGCVAMDTVMIMACGDSIDCTVVVPIMETQDLCSGNPADLTAAEANVLAGVADATQITGVVNWYTDAALTMAYTGDPINHSGATCDPEMTTLYAEVVCNDGTTIPAGQIDFTVYPFAEVMPPMDGSCVVTVAVPNCPNLTLSGPTNPTGGADLGNWDAASGTYTGQNGDMAGTLDFMITGGTAPCDMGTLTVDIPACNTDSTACTGVAGIMEMQDLCSGNAADLAAAEANVLAGVADPTQITGVVNWYTDATLTMAYTGDPINHSGATCDPEMTTLYAEVVCNDGVTIPAGQIDFTVYPFAEVMPPMDGSCVVTVAVPNCPNLTLSGPTNPTGGADVGNWDVATGTYTVQNGDTAGTLDFMITGGTAPCDMGTLTIDIPACNTDTTGCDNFMVDIAACTAGPAPTIVYEDLEGTYPDGQLGILPDVYVFCEPGCVEAFPMGGTAPLMYEWFELSMECNYDFNAPIANTADASGLGTGTYTVVVTDANGCTASQEVKVFIDEDATLTTSDDAEVCAGEVFDLEGTALPGPGFCLEYCGGALPQCPVDASSIITVCMEFDHTYISDLSFELVAPNGTVIPLVMGQCCPNGDNDARQFCFTNDTSGGAVALDWNTTGAGGTDLLGLGTGISGTWLPETGIGAFNSLVGIDANGGPWAMIVTDIIGGDSGTFFNFNVTITSPGDACNTVFQSPDFNADIPDNQQSFTYETPVVECVDQPNCIASYQWTGTDGFDSGVIPITPQTDMLNTLPPVPVTVSTSTTYTLTVTDCYGCTTTSEVIITECDAGNECTAVTPIMEMADACGGQAPDLSTAEANVLAGVADPALTTGVVNWFTDAAYSMPYTVGTVINHSGATCDPEMVTLYAQVVCNDGVVIPAGQIDLTVYPFGPEVAPGAGCTVMLDLPACGNLTFGTASNATGGANAANWDAATGTYNGQVGDAAGTIDIMITGGTAPCDMGTVTIDIPACTDDSSDDCTTLDVAMETLEECGGTAPDLTAIEAAILGSAGDPTLITNAVNWYFDVALTMPYTAGGPINHSDSDAAGTCDPGTVILYGIVECLDGATIGAGTVTITVYPFAEVTPPGEGSCETIVMASSCPNLTLGAVSNATGGVDLANWDAATGTYTALLNDPAGSFDIEVTGGTAPCDSGTLTVNIPECTDDGTGGTGFDLALAKTLGAGQAATVAPGDNVSFDITVTNQGTVDAFDILVNDYVPAGYTFDPALNPAWGDTDGDGNPDQVITSLAAGGMQTITIILTVNDPFVGSMADLVNYAEIRAADDDMDPNNTPPTDDDSTPNNDPTDDAGGTPGGADDDYIDGDGTGTPNDGNDTTDEDDQDPAFVDEVVDPNDCTTLDIAMETIEACSGESVVDLAGIEATILGSVADPSLITNAVNWYFDNGLTMPYTVGGPINHSDSNAAGTCDPGTVTLYGVVECLDGEIINAGTITITVYPFAEVTPPGDGSCVTTVAVADCPNLTLGVASNPTGGVDLANWDAATGTYTGQLGDAAGTLDIDITGGTPPCDDGVITINIPACTDDGSGTGFDLALAKTLGMGQASTVAPGDDVSFDITITNQGTVDAFNILVNDYIPAGYTFDPALNPGWGDTDGDGNPDQVIASLAAGGMQTITIILTVNDPFVGSMADLVNYAEISAADDDMDPNNTPPTDEDSTPNNDPTDDAGGTPGGADDDYIDGDGTGTPNDGNDTTDEDDQDPAFVDEVVDPNDCTTLDIAMESIESCGGASVDLTGIDAAILGSVGDPSLVTNAVNWYFDTGLTMPYTTGTPINHSDTDAAGTCNPGTVTLYGVVECLDGELINAGTVAITVYPFAEVTPPGDGSCETVVMASSCPNLTLGAVSNATGGVDLANWDAATGTYTAQLNDAAGTFDIEVTGGTAPCDSGTLTVSIPACTDDGSGDDCTTLDMAMENIESCGGAAVDLAAIDAAILGSVADPAEIISAVNWYFDAGLTMPYTAGGAINYSDSDAAGTCDPGTVTLYGEVVCNDGASINAGTIAITVYPFAEVTPPVDGSCVTIVTASSCPNLMLGAVSNATGGVDLANWDAALGTYMGQLGDVAGTFDIEVTGGTAPCDSGILTVNIPACVDDGSGDDCTTLDMAMETLTLCGGIAPDLTAIETAILGSIADPSLVTNAVNWYTDAALTMLYTAGGPINHSDSDAAGTCNPGTVTLYGQVVCLGGASINAGTITITVYPFAEVQSGNGCEIVVTAPNCPNLMIGAASNATGGASLANWDAATNTYTGILGDAAGTIDVAVTGGTAPCDAGTITINIPACTNDGGGDACTSTTEPTVSLEVCGGLTPDLSSAEATILAGIGDVSLITGDVIWYTDAGLTTQYNGGPIDHDDSTAAGTCEAGIITLYAQVICGDGERFFAGLVNLTVYPFAPNIAPAGPGCMLVVTPACPGDIIGVASNATGGASLDNWDPNTGVYTAFEGDFAGSIDLEITSANTPCGTMTYTLQIPPCGTPDEVPTVGEWGLIILGLLMSIVAVVGIRQRREEYETIK